MTVVAFVVLAIYTFSLLYITVYCLLQFNLLYHYKQEGPTVEPPALPAGAATGTSLKRSTGATTLTAYTTKQPRISGIDLAPAAPPRFPFVTVQLPIYNELYVIGRLIDAVAAFDYPRDRYEIHILDDSTDETVALVAEKVKYYRARGYQIKQIIRAERQGYKAGALRDGTQLAGGEFIAIFDADFVPEPSFLRRTIPYFTDPTVGVVQTRWEHLNEDYSLITRLQALQLNVHFTVEQVGRMNGGHLLQFNGTAGVWRRAAIDAGGGWQPDTLTEDLDLSIRSQLAGYKIRYLERVGSPAELPVEMNSFKSQQHRWMKGGAETARKMLPDVWHSELALGHKVQATAHLLASSIFLFVFLCGVFSVPLLFLFSELAQYGFSKNFFALFLAGLLSVIGIYYVANVQSVANKEKNFAKSVFKFVFLFPLFLALSMGLSLHNSVAVLQGYRGKKSPFVRTPKFNISTVRDKLKSKKYLSGKLNLITVGEGVLCVYFLFAVWGAFYLQNTTFVVFHALLALGYGAIFFFSVKHLGLAK
ncbi:cellulose synthase/poly-beta-1,6-N-acetylglucosamine synthase-like glycosyltransferase [Lewinella aquimaris]|uniref:Cellulose synthase/poly-beta-1,6-N-acetylglucosamine synthase-like glycosyltransferase n=1 Tax=Neolewinella aquimaris TaxID=1835722 RepID=A0A840E567_9BACT|nr:cellulose synthase family protein [Neolewinella aquimaris]MBB4078872.1 cellulose synthase/poly-beta-1,6-N-acetylglucosamine synthase-like glycosyltransferase [Neolewinella aquimaris]